jgi:hypothetical protein
LHFCLRRAQGKGLSFEFSGYGKGLKEIKEGRRRYRRAAWHAGREKLN